MAVVNINNDVSTVLGVLFSTLKEKKKMQIQRTNAEIKIAIQVHSGQYYAFPRTA